MFTYLEIKNKAGDLIRRIDISTFNEKQKNSIVKGAAIALDNTRFELSTNISTEELPPVFKAVDITVKK